MSEHALKLTAAEKLRGVMPAWKVKLVKFMATLLVGFGALWGFAPKAVEETKVVSGSGGSVDVRGFAGGSGGRGVEETVVVRKESWRERMGSWGMKLGVSFLAMLVVGMVLRAFVKILAGVVILIALVGGGLAFFGVSGAEVEKAKKEVEGTVTWAEGQADRLREKVSTIMPNAMAGLAGLAAGFKRK